MTRWFIGGGLLLRLAGSAIGVGTPPAESNASARALLTWTAISPTNAQIIQSPTGRYLGRIAPQGNTQSFYDEAGRFRGRAIRSGNMQTVYDAAGRYTGKLLTDSAGVRFYEASGGYSGRAVRNGATLNYYGRTGAYLGRSSTSGFGSVQYYDAMGRRVTAINFP
ncbi:MAG: hypothetical protein NTV49_04370 [Kiritimatiellaeota bacterium]|nr:hypothetical protein [Kiritimatiellota bacterium]